MATRQAILERGDKTPDSLDKSFTDFRPVCIPRGFGHVVRHRMAFYNGRMTYRVDAIFEGGVFRPTDRLDLPDGLRVSLNVNTKPTGNDDLDDVQDMLDSDFAQTCSANAESAPSLAEIRGILGAFSGSLADRISEERDER
jgi:predicted DNA-binding antitoxin AbrB/MazE fold protein